MVDSDYILRLPRGTAAQWELDNPVLPDGQLAYITDTSQYKVGNGVDDWLTLPIATGIEGPIGPEGPRGQGITVRGTVPTANDLPPSSEKDGDFYIATDTGEGWVWDGVQWNNTGVIQGPDGADGATGPAGPPGPTGVSTDANNQATLGGDGLIFVNNDSRYVRFTGTNTMTSGGKLIFPFATYLETVEPVKIGDPVESYHAASKNYVDGRIWYGSQSEYDAIGVKDQSVLYVII